MSENSSRPVADQQKRPFVVSLPEEIPTATLEQLLETMGIPSTPEVLERVFAISLSTDETPEAKLARRAEKVTIAYVGLQLTLQAPTEKDRKGILQKTYQLLSPETPPQEIQEYSSIQLAGHVVGVLAQFRPDLMESLLAVQPSRFARVEGFIRDNPWICGLIGIAAVGLTTAAFASRNRVPEK